MSQKVKVDITFIWDWDLLRQTPGRSGLWGPVEFSVNAENEVLDYWVIYDDVGQTQSRAVPPERTILFTSEPKSVKNYPQGYTDQFGMVVTSRPDIQHANRRLMATGLPWFTGRRVATDQSHTFVSDYDSLRSEVTIPKSKLASIISSNKNFTSGHAQRLAFAEAVSERFAGQVDFFGRGLRDFSDKADVLRPYKYHIVLENSCETDYWTEKLSDAFLNECYPIYSGCPNIHDYFPESSMSCIDIANTHDALEAIERILKSALFYERAQDVRRAKALCLDRYNLFPLIADLVTREVSAAFLSDRGRAVTEIKPIREFGT